MRTGVLALCLLAAACVKKPVVYAPTEPVPATSEADATTPPDATPPVTPEPAKPVEPVVEKQPEKPAPPPVTMYSLEEALEDVQTGGPLQLIGTGAWPGIFKISACAYKNAKVIVINIYCTKKEMNAARIDVLSPTKGRATIYAETKGPVSAVKRADYFTFKAETQPVPTAASGLPPLTLSMSFADLAAWDKQRSTKHVVGCFGGIEMKKPQAGCLRELADQSDAWQQRNRGFLAEPPKAWYDIVKDMRARAAKDGKQATTVGG